MNKFVLLTEVLKDMMSWKVALDVLLIAALIFLIYRTFRSLGTWRVLLGILGAATIFLIANFLELEGISWIYSNLSQVAVLGVIVIFQPEIRKVFEKVVSLKRSETGKDGADLFQLVSDAVFALARQKWGAILVFPGKEHVRQWFSGGFALDAEPSFPLVMSIFDPNSSGHDGALIIENGKFSMFGVRLPISKSDNLPSEFGTRHQAAMGLTEVTDALVVVVSEEKGLVSTFWRGRLRRINDADDLYSKISSHWEKASSYMPKTSLKQFKWKLLPEICLSIMIALIFWGILATSYTNISERNIIVPIEYVSVPQNLTLVGNKPTEIKLRTAGPKPDLDMLNTSQLSVKIDLSKAMAGKQTLAVNEDSIRVPKRVQILDMEPASLSISLEDILNKEIVVKPQLVGKLPQGLELESVEINPQKIMALISASADKNTEISLMTTPIYLENITNDTTLFCKIIGSSDAQPVDKRWPDVQVQIRVRFKGEKRN